MAGWEFMPDFSRMLMDGSPIGVAISSSATSEQ
jgi:hypothetical protein